MTKELKKTSLHTTHFINESMFIHGSKTLAILCEVAQGPVCGLAEWEVNTPQQL